MLFNTWVFAAFFVIVFVVYWLLGTPRRQNPFLLVVSLYFYGYGGVRFLGLILLCSLTAYVAGVVIETRPRYRRLALVSAAVISLGVLFTFKYFNFFIETIGSRLGFLGFEPDDISLRLALPIGISFFTFQAIGYVVDVHRGTVPAERNPVDFFLFITFFPQLVAGPIERAAHLLPEFKKRRRLSDDDVLSGCYLIAQGLAKKIVIADNIKPIVDTIFGLENASGPLVLAGLIGFTFQIYCDFSGYSDIARGAARLLGFRLMLNFERPYWSASPAEFWRRWHISLSNWFRDYVYIALGGNRRGPSRTYVNLFTTMVLSGLWHGASVNFVLWGAFHGGLLILHRLWADSLPDTGVRATQSYRLLSIATTFALTVYGWMLFRITEWSTIVAYTDALFTDWSLGALGALGVFSMGPYILMAIAIDIVESQAVDRRRDDVRQVWAIAPYLAVLVMTIALFGAETGGDFIYFKF
jgi:D-alanyl-lipoteichoic acid acyltransferase DltB (MBOAT superfamily)